MSKYGRAAVKGILHTQGTKIVNGDNEEIILEGYGVGNWMNPEGFMIGAPGDSGLGLEQMDKLTGFDGTKERVGVMYPTRFDRHRSVDAVVKELCGEEIGRAHV